MLFYFVNDNYFINDNEFINDDSLLHDKLLNEVYDDSLIN